MELIKFRFNLKLNFKAHKAECPSRGNFDRYMYSVSTSSGTGPAPPVHEQRPPPRSRHMAVQRNNGNNDNEEESWDHVSFTLFVQLSFNLIVLFLNFIF